MSFPFGDVDTVKYEELVDRIFAANSWNSGKISEEEDVQDTATAADKVTDQALLVALTYLAHDFDLNFSTTEFAGR
jgi:hypothetical protein